MANGLSEMSTSRPSSLRSSIDDGSYPPYRHPSTPRYPQASSAISRPSPSLVAAHGEFNAPNRDQGGNGPHDCAAQVGVEDSLRGSRNPHGLSLDKTAGYFPKSSKGPTEIVRQSNTTPVQDLTSLEDLLRMIATERLHHMPQKGSNWDRSIRALESP